MSDNENGRLRGQEITFTVAKATYTGRAEGNRMRVRLDVDMSPSLPLGRRWDQVP